MKANYYADCNEYTTGCRNCGADPPGRKRYYCSDECRDEFEANHFWGTARRNVLVTASICRVLPVGKRQARATVPDDTVYYQQVRGYVCACCERLHRDEEVNHIAPLNGERNFFGCHHHADGLESLCHNCHVMATREQGRRGMFGPDGVPLRLTALELLSGINEPIRVRKLRLV